MTKACTLGELVEWVLTHRNGKTFCYVEHLVAFSIKQAADEGTMLYAINPDGKICGIVTAHKDDEMKMVHIEDIICTESWAFKHFVKIFKERCQGYRLRAYRCKRLVNYNTMKLVNKILKEAK